MTVTQTDKEQLLDLLIKFGPSHEDWTDEQWGQLEAAAKADEWYEDVDNLVTLTAYLAEAGETARDVAYAVEKPWKYCREFITVMAQRVLPAPIGTPGHEYERLPATDKRTLCRHCLKGFHDHNENGVT